MAKIEIATAEIEIVMERALAFATQRGDALCSTAHVYIALQSYLKKSVTENQNPDNIEIKNKLDAIMNKYDITSKEIKIAFEDMYGKSLADNTVTDEYENNSSDDFSVEYDDDAKNLISSIAEKSKKLKETMTLRDLILLLFDRNYKLFILFSAVDNTRRQDPSLYGNPFDILGLYNEILDAFTRMRAKFSSSKLDKFPELRNINKYLNDTPNRVIVGMDIELRTLMTVLLGRTKNSAIITGKAGVGKTELVYKLAQKINNNEVPEKLKNKIIYELNVGTLQAGASFVGVIEQRVSNLIHEIRKNKDVILFVDEAHLLVQSPGNNGSTSNISNLLKTALSNNEIQMIGATTSDEYNKYFKKDSAFARRFDKIIVNEPSEKETTEILKALIPVNNEFFNKQLRDELISRIFDFGKSYSIENANPDKSIKIMEHAYSYSLLMHEKKKDVTLLDILTSISERYGINVSTHKAKDAEKSLRHNILGQQEPLSKVIDSLHMIELGIKNPEKPMLSMLLAGPTGVGKTETARIIARDYFGSDQNLIKLNMGEYTDRYDVSKITGSAPGFVGYDDETGLISQIRRRPNSVVLFDEIEKAHPIIQDLLLGILDDGILMDSHGEKISFTNSIIIFTTNYGYTKDYGKRMGNGFIKIAKTSDDIEDNLTKLFKPEFMGRLDEIVVYNLLNDNTINELIRRNRIKYEKLCNEKVKFTNKDLKEIKTNAKIKQYGARSLEDATKKQVYIALKRKKLNAQKTTNNKRMRTVSTNKKN